MLTVLMSMVGLKAIAYDAVVDGIYYNFSGTEAVVTYKDYSYNSYAGNVVIPSTVTYEAQNYSVTSIGVSAFSHCTGLTSIEIPNSVTSIGGQAFFGCSSLTSVIIPNSVTSIGSQAFEGSGLTSITIESGNTMYDSRNNCNAIIETATNTLIQGCKSTVIPSSVTSIGDYAFEDCTGLTSIEIPNSVTSIGSFAFGFCTGLTSIELPNSVTSIGSHAFFGSQWYNNQPDGLVYAGYVAYKYKGTMPANTSLTIEDGTLAIADEAFCDCSNLISITIPNSVTTIGYNAFYGTTWYDNQPNGLVYAGKVAYKYKGGVPANTSLTIEDGTLGIAIDLFGESYDCDNLTSITIPNSVTSIGDEAFANCSGLTSINVESGNTKYDSRNSCNAIIEKATNTLIQGCKTTVIPNSVTSIGDYAFYGSGLTSITIPNSVTSIGSSAFSGCSSLTSVTMGNGVTTIGESAFSYCSGLTSVTMGNGVTTIGERAFSGCSSLTSITIPDNVTTISEHLFDHCSKLTTVSLPDDITSIGNYAFYECSLLSSISLPDGITTIGEAAFALSGLTSITIPNSVTSIGGWAFGGCTGLTSVTFDNSTPTLGDEVFYNSSNLTDIYYPAYAYDYFTANAQTNVYTLHPQIKIDREWTTYCVTESFDVPEGIDAYVVNSYDAGVVTLQKVTTINQGQGVLLKPASVGTFYNATVCASAPDPYESNMLKGVTTATAIGATSGDYTNYIFTKVGDEIGFYPANAGTIPAYKAYLQIPTASLPSGAPSRLSIAIDDETTGIKPTPSPSQKGREWYDLNGRRVTHPTNGLYIINGKKVIIK